MIRTAGSSSRRKQRQRLQGRGVRPFLHSHPKVYYAQSKDFTGLFPTLPHDHIKTTLHQIIDEQFNFGGCCAISIPIRRSEDKLKYKERVEAHWLLASSPLQRQELVAKARRKEFDTLGRRSPRIVFTADNIKEMLDFFIDSAFVKIGSFIAHLDKGIFMGPKRRKQRKRLQGGGVRRAPRGRRAFCYRKAG